MQCFVVMLWYCHAVNSEVLMGEGRPVPRHSSLHGIVNMSVFRDVYRDAPTPMNDLVGGFPSLCTAWSQ